ncbi:AAA family ATPase [Candidatus Woesearchaeota archaeon]|nr:AAA family ATPase [Candidatus Woesearchaeota archaeon]
MIIGITGTLAAGKTTAVEFLETHGFAHYSVRAYLRKILEERGDELNRTNYVNLANSLRQEHGPSFIIEELYKEAESKGGHAIIESIRTIGEVRSLQDKGDFVLLGVNADPEVRYKRATTRGSETDRISYEQFLADEAREMTSTEEHKQNVGACLQMADYLIDNSGSLEEYRDNLKKLFVELDKA